MDRTLALSMTLALATLAPCQSRPTDESWLLQVEGNANELRLTHATRRAFAVDAPKNSTGSFAVELLDERGHVTHRVPLDLSHFCTDSTHTGQAPHVHGGRIIDHDIVCRAKVPALDDTYSLQIVRTDEGRTQVFQTITPGRLFEVDPAEGTSSILATGEFLDALLD